jgi:hypothetical protein
LEFRVLTTGLTFPQVHARAQRATLTQANTLDDYLFFVDGFEPAPGPAIIARQPSTPGQFECYMLAIPFPSALTTSGRYRLRFRVTGASPVTLQGFVDRFNGSSWDVFASGTITHSATGTTPARDPNLYCDPGFLPGPLTTAGAVGFAKWTTANEVLDNFTWTDLNNGQNPVPVTQSTSPTSASAGGSAFTLSVTGANFVPGSVVRWNGANRTTTYVSATQVNASITAADIAAAGSASVTVFNPTPGGGLSSGVSFTINAAGNPVPVLTSLSPTSATAGGSAFTLTANGSGFVSGSTVRWNGANRTTTFVSATRLTAAITAADIATAGSPNVTVFSPTPGGGTSSAVAFVVNGAGATTVNFDSPAPPGSPGSPLQGTFQGVDFGTGQWVWDGPYASNSTNHIFFNSASGTSRTFGFASPRILGG